MGEHYTRSTVSITHYCKACKTETEHRVDGTRLGSCLRCIERLNLESEQRKADELLHDIEDSRQGRLFAEEGGR